VKSLLPLVCVLGVACGLDEDTFRKRYDDLYCDVLEDECGGACLDKGDEVPLDCDFDKAKAEECLDGEWECLSLGDERGDPKLPQGPEACHDVFTNCTLGEGDGDDAE
jgi:hypothetical protein